MKVYQVVGYPKSHYFVRTWCEFDEIMRWMHKNKVGYLHESSSPHGIGFSLRSNAEWFLLRWL